MSEAMQPNVDEIAYWNSEAGARWAFYQEQMDRALAPLGAFGLEAASAGFGDHALDIGCGCGASSVALARAVGRTGSVVGVDVSQPMLAVANERARAAGLENIRFMLADAATENFGATTFGLAFSRFGVMFFDDPLRAFENVRRRFATVADSYSSAGETLLRIRGSPFPQRRFDRTFHRNQNRIRTRRDRSRSRMLRGSAGFSKGLVSKRCDSKPATRTSPSGRMHPRSTS